MENFNYLDKFLQLCPSYRNYYIVACDGFVDQKSNWNCRKEDDYLTTAKLTVINYIPNYGGIGGSGMSINSVYVNKSKGPYIKKDGRKLYLYAFKRK